MTTARSKPIQIRLTTDEYDLWAEAAKREGRTLSGFIRLHVTARAALVVTGKEATS
ncbi:MAG: DUF1778 domain-containing protein [Candidatus Nanopelagicales bacterium]